MRSHSSIPALALAILLGCSSSSPKAIGAKDSSAPMEAEGGASAGNAEAGSDGVPGLIGQHMDAGDNAGTEAGAYDASVDRDASVDGSANPADSGLTCLDADGDQVCDAVDGCPIGSNADADANGFADLCDTVLWHSEAERSVDCYPIKLSSALLDLADCLKVDHGSAPVQAQASVDTTFSDTTTLSKVRACFAASSTRSLYSSYSPCGGVVYSTPTKSAAFDGKHVVRLRFQSTTGYHAPGSSALTPVSVRWEIRGY